MNKRDQLLQWLQSEKPQNYIPAAFFIHFPEENRSGQAAVDKHLEYFNYTEMDFVKIQYEFSFPHLPQMKSPEDWGKMPRYGHDFFQQQLEVVEGIVKAVKGEAVVIQTLYSPFMSAGHTSSDKAITEHIKTSPQKVVKGLEVITESTLYFVRECINLGVDGFYASTQGGESHRFTGTTLFSDVIKPFDLAVMDEINASCNFNILHICDYNGGYDDLTPFLNYPGDIVNCPLKLGAENLSMTEAEKLFERPIMGGVDRHGTIASATLVEITHLVELILQNAPQRFILGADCTLPGDINWENIRTAISTAHNARK